MPSETGLNKLLWEILGSHMTDSGELGVEEVDELFNKIEVELKKQFPDIKRKLDYPEQNRLVLTGNDYVRIVALFYNWEAQWLRGSQ